MADTQKRKGTSLAKGPVGVLGLVGLIYGISALIFGGHGFSTQHVPNGAVYGKTWLGLEVNGWSEVLFIAAGLLLMLGAPLHWGAKSMSLIVGLVLGAACLIALARGNGVFGIFAANGLTELVWGAAAGLLILLSLLPRVGGKAKRDRDGDRDAGVVPRRPAPEVERRPRTERQSTDTLPPVRDNPADQPRPHSPGAYRTHDHEAR